MRLASVRFMDGGSGSFVSPDGLMITNHHVGLGCIQNVSSAENDFVKTGFYAATREKETACPGYEVNVLHVDGGRDGQGAGRREAADVGRRGARGAQGRDRRDRERVRHAHEAALQRGEPVPGRRVPALPVQEVHGRAARVRPRAVDGLLRRRPRQLHVSAPRPRHLPDAGLRGRQAGQARVVPAAGRRRASATATSCSSPGTPARPRGSRRWPASSTCATRRCPSAWRCSSAGWPPCTRTRPSARSRSGGPSTRSSASRTRQKALGGYYAALLDTKAMAVKARGGEGPAREGGGRPRPRPVDRRPLGHGRGHPGEARPAGHGRAARRLRRIAAAGRSPDRSCSTSPR